MNEDVRVFLIRRAKKRRPVTYTEINQHCRLGLNFNKEFDRQTIGNILGTISSFEFEAKRPLISSIVIYKSDKVGIGLGNGFYNLAQELGFGAVKTLKQENFAELEMKRTFDYWYQQTQPQQYSVPFFTLEDLKNFNDISGSRYRRDEAIPLQNAEIIKRIYKKSNFWGQQLDIDGFEVLDDNRWQLGVSFKKYTWSRIYRKGDKDKMVFFTVGIDEGEAGHKYGRLVFKLDCQWASQDPNKRLKEHQIKKFRNYLKGSGARWKEVGSYNIDTYDWQKLIHESRAFIYKYMNLYDEVIDVIWAESTPNNKRKLKLTAPPKGKHKEYPKKEYSFKGVEKDYQAEQQHRQFIGDKGEQLVIEYEKNRVRENGYPDLVNDVKKVKDGEGYDIYSFDKNGNVTYIEIKTTKGKVDTPFYMSDNEMEFMRQNPKKYKIYRLYNFDPVSNRADFYIISDVENKIISRPTQFEVQIKQQ